MLTPFNFSASKYFLFFGLSLFFGQAWAAEALDLLQRMSKAMNDENYTGTFVYRHKDKVETLKILHRSTPQGINERLITLSGKPREIIRDESVVTCIWPESKLVLVDKTNNHERRNSRFPGIVPKDLDRLPVFYDLTLSGSNERVANRSTYVVNVTPKDKYRYGYRLWIDQQAFLLMRSDLLNEKGEAIEQVLFTDLEVNSDLPDTAFEPELLEEGYQWREVGKAAQHHDEENRRWHASALPPGFSLQVHKQRLKGEHAKSVEHMIFSDGMASVSVFIEPQKKSKEQDSRSVNRGALNVYGRQMGGHRIVVLGEVPTSTVKLIADSITLKKNQ